MNVITYRKIDESYFKQYDKIPMNVRVKSIYQLVKIDSGLGGLLLEEIPVDPYNKDLGGYTVATKYATEFDITNWAFFMAFLDDMPIGAVTIASRTEGVQMLDGRDDMSVLWDLRIDDRFKQRGIGSKLVSLAVDWSKSQGFSQMKIECQNNNVPACRFYKKQGAILGKVDEYAYFKDAAVRDEVQLIWYLDI